MLITATIVDHLLRTLNRPDPAIDQEWLALAKQRLEELRSGQVEAIPGDEVLAKVRARFNR